MILHKTRVANSIVRSRYADTSTGFLHDGSQDETVVDIGLLSDLLDGVPDLADFVLAVIGNAVSVVVCDSLAGGAHGDFVVVEPGFLVVSMSDHWRE